MPPKKPFKLPKFPKKPAATPKPSSLPTTPQDHLDLAIEHEEQGDRWIISDLSKTARSYQKAYESYKAAVAGDPQLVDAWYNLLRLMYHTYETYQDVPACTLTSVQECEILGLDLLSVKREYDRVVGGLFHGWLNWECAYNLVLINTEIIEEGTVNGDEVLKLLEESMGLVANVLEHQMKELDSFMRRLEVGSDQEEKATGENEEEEYQMYEQITPSSVIETVTSGFKLIQAALEFCDDRQQIQTLSQGVQAFINETLLSSVQLILSKFNPGQNIEDPHHLNLKPSEVYELQLVQKIIRSFLITDYEELVTHWSTYGNDEEIAARHLAEADSFESFRELEQLNSEQTWMIVSRINQSLKTAQGLVQKELEQERANKTPAVSSKVSKIVEVLINRADNELLRATLSDYEPSVKNSTVLHQNCVNLLKSGLNFSQSNVGLREVIKDKLKREKLKRACVVRLVVLTKDTVTEDDLVRNLGQNYWKEEVEELFTAELYRQFSHKIQE